jgi:hypothetical protein
MPTSGRVIRRTATSPATNVSINAGSAAPVGLWQPTGIDAEGLTPDRPTCWADAKTPVSAAALTLGIESIP